jgi:serine/threonine protein kinase
MWTPGQTVLDRYRLVGLLGEGLGGETWEAEGPTGPVAVKLVKGVDARGLRDLFREAALLRELRHPHVVAYREFSDRPDEDCAILVTELVSGGDLEAWVALEGPRALPEVVRLGRQLLDALDALEKAGVLHRDLKPRNVLVALDDAGAPALRVADFGISRRTQQGVARTLDRALTPAYAAPEQFAGGALTRAADLFALGGLLGFMATGQHPGGGQLTTGYPGLDHLIGALRHPDPAQRPDLAAARLALDAITADRAPSVRPVGSTFVPEEDPTPAPARAARPPEPAAQGPGPSTETLPPTPRPRRGGWWAASAIGLLAAVGLGAWLAQRTPGGAPDGPATPVAGASAPATPTADAAPLAPDALPPAPPSEPVPSAAAPLDSSTPARPAPPASLPVPAPPAPSPAGVTRSSKAAPSSPAAAPPSQAATVTLFVNSRPWSWVELDARPIGRTTDQGSRFTVPAGTHHLRLRSEDGATWERDLDLTADKRICVNIRTGTELAC